MVVLGKRVRGSRCAPKIASTSRTPNDFAASSTIAQRPAHCSFDKITSLASSAGIRCSNLDVVEARWVGDVAGPDHLLRLTLSAVRDARQNPVVAIRDSRARIPKLSGDAAIGRILEHADAPPILDLPSNFAAELEVITLVVDGPASVRLHVYRVADAAKNFLDGLLTWQQTHVGHADERQPRPTGGAHRSVRSRLTDGGGSLARGHVTHDLAVSNNIGGLRRDAFVVEGKAPQSGTMLGARIADRVHDFRAVAQI